MENKATDAAVGDHETGYGKHHHDTYGKKNKGFFASLDGTGWHAASKCRRQWHRHAVGYPG